MKTKKKSSIEVSKNSENEDIKLSKRVIDLFIWYQIEDSNAWLRWYNYLADLWNFPKVDDFGAIKNMTNTW